MERLLPVPAELDRWWVHVISCNVSGNVPSRRQLSAAVQCFQNTAASTIRWKSIPRLLFNDPVIGSIEFLWFVLQQKRTCMKGWSAAMLAPSTDATTDWMSARMSEEGGTPPAGLALAVDGTPLETGASACFGAIPAATNTAMACAPHAHHFRTSKMVRDWL